MMKFFKQHSLVLITIFLYGFFFGAISVLRHYQFRTQAWDMGIFTQTFWNAAHGQGMINTIEEIPRHMGIHMSPFLYLLMPAFYFFQSPYTLLVLQTLALALSAWPLFLIAKRVLANRAFAYLVTLGYLLSPSLHAVNLYDFHEVAFFIPLFLTAFYFFLERRYMWASVFAILAAMTIESAVLAVLVFGLYSVWRGYREKNVTLKWWGVGVAICSLLYFMLSIKYLMPALGGGLVRLDRYSQLGSSIPEIALSFFTRPRAVLETLWQSEKFFYLLWIFLPVLFLPFISKEFVLLLPGLAQNLLTNYEFQFSAQYQYDALVLPMLWIAAVFGLKRLLDKYPNRVRLVTRFLAAAVLAVWMARSPVGPRAFPYDLFQTPPEHDRYRQMIAVVPANVSVSAYTHLVPHLALREDVSMLGREKTRVDIVLADTQESFGFIDREQFIRYLESYTTSQDYVTQLLDERYLIVVRKELVADAP